MSEFNSINSVTNVSLVSVNQCMLGVTMCASHTHLVGVTLMMYFRWLNVQLTAVHKQRIGSKKMFILKNRFVTSFYCSVVYYIIVIIFLVQ